MSGTGRRRAFVVVVLVALTLGTVRSATAGPGAPTAAELLARLGTCAQVSHGLFATDDGGPATVPVCARDGVVSWRADLDVDCDGRPGSACNRRTDPWFQDDTAFHRADGAPLDAETLPYVVIPQNSPVFAYSRHGIAGGDVVAVVYRGRVVYAVFGDTGPPGIVGEASYATARALGIDPDPRTGGADAGVTYLVFPGVRVSPVDSHARAVRLGTAATRAFLERR
ncbi:glycoside hydrolase family 75 protein [Actinocatenispora rupis]|uniref:Chitosanase of glycosyl hydrolase group 75 n=1 Tax=Actinocatenispora rupis TaxID=519421 RepID=A0A8J3JBB3_9ACTN|nr:glycoside hydrolase family 75 protein [Actinocatenispora rupis]GID13407.1 hypothetical protein Aru02nite_42960 [Actinocatenispora rupis]